MQTNGNRSEWPCGPRWAGTNPRSSKRPALPPWPRPARISSCSTPRATPSTASASWPGKLTPVFFGSAMTNCGLEPLLEHFVELAPRARARARPPSGALDARRSPTSPASSSRSRRTWIRSTATASPSCASARAASRAAWTVKHVRTGSTLSLSRSVQFMAQERTVVDEAYSGDIVGLWDPGVLRIGDSLCEGAPRRVRGHPALLARALRARARSTIR